MKPEVEEKHPAPPPVQASIRGFGRSKVKTSQASRKVLGQDLMNYLILQQSVSLDPAAYRAEVARSRAITAYGLFCDYITITCLAAQPHVMKPLPGMGSIATRAKHQYVQNQRSRPRMSRETRASAYKAARGRFDEAKTREAGSTRYVSWTPGRGRRLVSSGAPMPAGSHICRLCQSPGTICRSCQSLSTDIGCHDETKLPLVGDAP